ARPSRHRRALPQGAQPEQVDRGARLRGAAPPDLRHPEDGLDLGQLLAGALRLRHQHGGQGAARPLPVLREPRQDDERAGLRHRRAGHGILREAAAALPACRCPLLVHLEPGVGGGDGLPQRHAAGRVPDDGGEAGRPRCRRHVGFRQGEVRRSLLRRHQGEVQLPRQYRPWRPERRLRAPAAALLRGSLHHRL
ncbi:MAG: Probable NADH dehydrogenase/NAD(P)H nitroreductase, partial [uncultured Craurococcus sp.]